MANIEFHTLLKFFIWRARRLHSRQLTPSSIAASIGVARPVFSKWCWNKQSPGYQKNRNRPILLKLAEVLRLQPPEIDLMFDTLGWDLTSPRTKRELEEMANQIVEYLQDKVGSLFDFMDPAEDGADSPSFEPLLARTDLFVGREAQVIQISEQLMHPATRLLTLVGPGGRGKTQLALHMVQHVRSRLPSMPVIVNLAPVADAGRVIDSIAEGLGLQEGPQVGLLSQVQEYLRSHRGCLIVLDNMEHVLGAAPMLATLLVNPRVKFLATSRERLNLEFETIWEVPPLAFPDPEAGHSADLLAASAVELFLRWSSRVGGDVPTTPDNLRAIAAICGRLDGNPLAIRLAAARARHKSVQEIERQLHVRMLDQAPADAPFRHRSMQATLDWSYDLLSAAEQELFTQLAIFRGGATVEAIATICTAGDELKVANLLALLIDKYLIFRWSGMTSASRYAMHELLREYAAGHLEGSDRLAAVEDRHAAYFFGRAEHAAPRLRSAQQKLALELLDQDRDNLRVALQWLFRAGRDEQAAQMCIALGHYWYLRSLLQEGRDMFARALEGTLTPPTRMKALYHQGWLLTTQGHAQEAMQCYDQAELICREVADQGSLAYVLFGKGRLERARNPQAARALLAASAQRAKQDHDLWLWSSAINIQGVLEPDLDRAYDLLEQSHSAARRIGDLDRLSFASNNIGIFILNQGDFQRAKDHFEEARQLAITLGNTYNLAFSLSNLATAMMDLKEPAEQIIPIMEESLRLQRQFGDQEGITVNLVQLAEQELKLGQVELAWSRLMEGIVLADLIDIVELRAMALDGLGGVARQLGRLREAAIFFSAAERAYLETGKMARPPSSQLDQLRSNVDAEQLAQWGSESQRVPLAELIRIGRGLVANNPA